MSDIKMDYAEIVRERQAERRGCAWWVLGSSLVVFWMIYQIIKGVNSI